MFECRGGVAGNSYRTSLTVLFLVVRHAFIQLPDFLVASDRVVALLPDFSAASARKRVRLLLPLSERQTSTTTTTTSIPKPKTKAF